MQIVVIAIERVGPMIGDFRIGKESSQEAQAVGQKTSKERQVREHYFWVPVSS